ncbi:MAG: NADH-quinone oxidoreductase subunit C, partial [Verrucomicrobiia bacterium]
MSLLDDFHIKNGQKTGLSEVPTVRLDEFSRVVAGSVKGGQRLVALFGMPPTDVSGIDSGPAEVLRLFAVLAHEARGTLHLLGTSIFQANYPAITPACTQAHMFEREIAEQWGVVPEGHPWLKPVRFHMSHVPGRDAW